MRPPVRYPGGKQAVARAIADMLPVHDHYVEPFMGAASVFFAKPPSPIETLNDLDREIFNFFRVLRDRPADLGRVCSLTPYSKAEYEAAVAPLGPAADEVDAARRTWVRLSQGRGSRVSSPSWQNKIQGDFSSPRYLKGYLARMAPCAERLLQASLECRPALEVIAAYDRARTVFMVDPPYLTDVRCDSRGMYAHEMGSEAEHEELLDALTSCRGKVLLCGYRSGLYDRRLKAWARTDLPARASSGAARVESVWTNYRPERQPGLWEASGGGHRGPPLLPEDPGGGPVHTAGPVRRAARRHLQLADPRPLPEPIVYRGGQGLRRLDPT